jgi:predicted RecA/RadA family phage recombinase
MKNYKGSGDIVTVAAPEDASSGEFLIKGGIHGVAGVAVSSGENVPLHREGVFTLPKETGTAWSVGDRLFFNTSTKVFSRDPTDRPVRAVAAAAALSGDTTGDVLLCAEGGMQMRAGQLTTASATDTVVTGLSTVVGAVATYDTDPADPNTYVSATIGDQAGSPAAGSIIIKTWKQSGTDPTPVAADAFSKKVNWIAFGY